jgi:hypothetical protein
VQAVTYIQYPTALERLIMEHITYTRLRFIVVEGNKKIVTFVRGASLARLEVVILPSIKGELTN